MRRLRSSMRRALHAKVLRLELARCNVAVPTVWTPAYRDSCRWTTGRASSPSTSFEVERILTLLGASNGPSRRSFRRLMKPWMAQDYRRCLPANILRKTEMMTCRTCGKKSATWFRTETDWVNILNCGKFLVLNNEVIVYICDVAGHKFALPVFCYLLAKNSFIKRSW